MLQWRLSYTLEKNSMRPPERIDEIMELVCQIWKRSPDLRFLQLLYILQYDFSNMNGGRGRVEASEEDAGLKRVGYDLFHTEDKDFLKFLRGYINKKY